MRTPIYTGLLQSDLDFAGFKPLNADLSDYAVGGGGGGGSNSLITINVQDAPYSAAGDGVTDDTVAIQGALNALNATVDGGVLFFPNGTYLCNGAFDATTNSILKIPYNPYVGPLKTIMMQGQTPASFVSPSGAIIKTTRTDGAGTSPALLGAYTPVAFPSDDLTLGYFNITNVHIKNLSFFVPDNPTLGAVRLDTAFYANVQDVVIIGGGSEPTHPAAVGLWMPNGGNGGQSYARNVQITGLYEGVAFSEHFVGHNVVIVVCKIAVGLITGYQPAQANFQTYWCPTHIAQQGVHLPVQFVARLEDGDPSAAPAWQLVVNHVDDSANTIWGTMDYIRVREPEREHADIILNGASNLHLFNMYTSSNNWTRIGTDARLVSITGGAKLQVRNPGTGLWADADQWTNP